MRRFMVQRGRALQLALAVAVGVFLGWFVIPWRSPPSSVDGAAALDATQGRGDVAEVAEQVTPPRIPIVDNSSRASKIRDPRLTHLLELELQFESTLKSCLSSYCFDEPVVVSGKKLTRIGFLAPPNSGSDTLIAMLNRAAHKDLVATGAIENSTHVPAYGYGKNHGWTRIIRLVRRVIPHALSTLGGETSAAAATTTTVAVSPELFDLQVRQLVRWQCRLSHVAAHTKMLTVFMDDVILRPVIELDKILSFIGIRAARSDLVEASNAFGRKLQADLDMHGVDYNPTSHAVIEHLDLVPQDLIPAALSALENEMTSTDTLAKWPCKGFRELEKTVKLPIPAKDLAADCSSPQVVCSVGFDQRGG